MRSLPFIVALTALLCVTKVSAQKAAPELPGRYQLFQGEYEFTNIKGETHRIRSLFKLDTSTGAMYICDGAQIDAKHISPSKPGHIMQRRSCRPFEDELIYPNTQ